MLTIPNLPQNWTERTARDGTTTDLARTYFTDHRIVYYVDKPGYPITKPFLQLHERFHAHTGLGDCHNPACIMYGLDSPQTAPGERTISRYILVALHSLVRRSWYCAGCLSALKAAYSKTGQGR